MSEVATPGLDHNWGAKATRAKAAVSSQLHADVRRCALRHLPTAGRADAGRAPSTRLLSGSTRRPPLRACLWAWATDEAGQYGMRPCRVGGAGGSPRAPPPIYAGPACNLGGGKRACGWRTT